MATTTARPATVPMMATTLEGYGYALAATRAHVARVVSVAQDSRHGCMTEHRECNARRDEIAGFFTKSWKSYGCPMISRGQDF
eukprot:7426241-Pyramimonas_sp.AAC.1